MTCFHPLSAYQTDDGEIVFAERGRIRRPLSLPCGQCIGCRLERSRQWATRCMHEAQLHDSNCFITLTYDDDHLPSDMSLNYYHFQCFLKRVRSRLGSFRFYMCGEYGERYLRPHYHACLFGLRFTDGVLFKENPSRIYTSKTLNELWGMGENNSFGDVTFESAAYVARYVMKKVTGDAAEGHYSRVSAETGEILQVEPEFTRMSLKPGIGFDWIRLYHPEVLARGTCVVRGHESSIPRFYKNYLKGTDEYQALEYLCYKEAMRPEVQAHTTPERLAVRENVLKAGMSQFSRSIE